jgi:adenine-specific DNA methylase
MLIYGATTWGDLYTSRQLISLVTLVKKVSTVAASTKHDVEQGIGEAIQTCLAFAIDRQADSLSSLVTWTAGGEFQGHTFARQALPIVWDFAEVNPWCDSSGNWMGAIEWVAKVCEQANATLQGHVHRGSATDLVLPDDSVHALVTDPPYYDAIAYSALADYFYVWLKRSLRGVHGQLLSESLPAKRQEIIVDMPHELNSSQKDVAYYERSLTEAFSQARRVRIRRGPLVK